MNTPGSRLRVAPTSALVLSYVKDLYTEGLSGKYMQYIDFSAVQDLAVAMNNISAHFGAIIRLRKRMVRYLIKQFINRYPRQQVCIIAAGLDPLALTLSEDYPQLLNGIFEVDQAWMDEKISIYAQLSSHLPLPVSIQTDITNTIQLKRQLRDAGYNAAQPTIIIFEGIIHYITEEQFRDIMQCFTTRNGRNTVIMDYGLIPEEISNPMHRSMAIEVGELAERALNVKFHRYSRKKILNTLELLNAEVYNIYDMQAVEYIMHGRNRDYYQPGDGMLEMAAFHL
ncbi:class I SAM-dependent methyltransferase [uncultured Chitinophaga sp.]|mgnify:CR=1 FL=1|jgi:O-Methyltransferase involved in polyketide biosynthesis|uniref:class I SAM-dependent methyltransferase n=1 Tax=uncultured Chitinophaga sp. TaxID=339340 RepID=UPI0026299BAD|nr:class I SAM-dependent methyltransferase [uncultured Chitinophaga sp.]